MTERAHGKRRAAASCAHDRSTPLAVRRRASAAVAAGSADCAAVGQHRAGELLLLHVRDRVCGQRRRHGAVLCADHEGDSGSHRARWRAASVAAGMATGGRGAGGGRGHRIHLRAYVRHAGRADAARRLASLARHRSRHQLLRGEDHLPAASGHPVCSAFGIASDGWGSSRSRCSIRREALNSPRAC